MFCTKKSGIIEESFLAAESKGFDADKKNEKPLPCPIKYATAKRTVILYKLVEAGFLDFNGNLARRFFGFSLPPLCLKEIELIKAELEKPFTCQIEGGYSATTSIASLLRILVKDNTRWGIRSAKLIGGYVTYLLFCKTDYAKKVFELLGIKDFYDATLFQSMNAPPDIDLRLQIPEIANHHDLQQIRDFILYKLSYWVIQNIRSEGLKEPFKRQEAEEKIYQECFKELVTVDSGINKFQLISFKTSSFDLIFFSEMQRSHVFTIDDLFIPLESILFYDGQYPTIPQSHRGNPLESFFHYFLGIIKSEKTEQIDGKGWLRLNSLVIKGNILFESTEPLLLKPFYQIYIRDQKNLTAAKKEISDWLSKHHPGQPLAHFCYLFSLCSLLKEKTLPEEMETLWTLLSKTELASHPVASLIYELIVEKGIPFHAIQSFIQTICFVSALKNERLENETHVQTAYENQSATSSKECPVIQLQLSRNTILLDFEPHGHLKNLLLFFLNNQELCRQCAPQFEKLLSLLCPEKETAFAVDMDLTYLEGFFLPLLDSPSLILQKIGLHYAFASQLSNEKKCRLADTFFLSHLKSSPDKKRTLVWFEKIIGKNENLDPEESDFEEKWISILFHKERNAEEIAFATWKDFYERTSNQVFSFELAKKLAAQQPSFSLRIYTILRQTDAFKKNRSTKYQHIIECIQHINRQTSRKPEHWALINYLGRVAKEILEITHLQPLENKKKLFSSSFIWFAKWFEKEDVKTSQFFIKKGLSHSYLIQEDKKIATEFKISLKIKMIRKAECQKEQKIGKLFKTITDSAQGQFISEEKEFEFLLTLIEHSVETKTKKIDEGLIQKFFQRIKEKKTTQDKRQAALQVILDLVNLSSQYPLGFIISIKKEIEFAFQELVDAHTSKQHKRKIIEESYDKRLALPSADFLYGTLLEWEQETDKAVESDKIEELRKISVYLENWEHCYPKHPLVAKIKCSLVAKWLKISTYMENPQHQEKCFKFFDSILPSDDPTFLELLTALIKASPLDFGKRLARLDNTFSKLGSSQEAIFIPLLEELESKLEDGHIWNLIHWLKSTTLFDEKPSEYASRISKIIQTSFEKGISLEIEKHEPAYFQDLYKLFDKYITSLKEIEPKIMHDFFSLCTDHAPALAFPAFQTLKVSKILDRDRYTFFAICSLVLCTLVKSKDPNILIFLEDYESEYVLYKEAADVEIDLTFHTYLLEGSVAILPRLDKKKHIETLRKIYGRFLQLETEVQRIEQPTLPKKALETCTGRSTFSYITLLCFSDEKTHKEEANNLIAKYQKEKPAVNWTYAIPLMNYLASTMQEKWQDLFNTIASFLSLSDSKLIDYTTVIKYLLKHPPENSPLKAANFFFCGLSHMKLDRDCWSLGRQIFEGLTKDSSKEGINAVSRLIVRMVPFYSEFSKNVGDSFIAEFLYIDILHWTKCVDEESKHYFFNQIDSALDLLPRLYANEPRLLDALEEAIVITYTLERSKFSAFAEQLWGLMAPEQAVSKKKKRLLLSEQTSFDKKIDFVRDLIGLHILNEDINLKSKITTYIKKLHFEFPKRRLDIEKLSLS